MVVLGGRRSALVASVACGALALGLSASAQEVPPTVEPGNIEREFQAVPDRYADGAVSVPSASGPVAPAGAENQRFVLRALAVNGVSVFPAETVSALYSDRINTEITLADLFGIAQDITKLYADNGYLLSVAFVPAQEISGGAAQITVYEGYVAEVEIAGDAGSARAALEQLGAQLTKERPLTAKVLERYVLLANDIPGVSVQAVIDRAESGPGAVKIIFATERQIANFALSVGNRGSEALGPYRVQASAAMNGFLLSGDRLRGDVVQATDPDELTFISGGYEAPVGANGFRLGGWFTWSDSDPGTELLEALAYNSDGLTLAIEGSYPLVRSRAFNLMLNGSFEYKDLESHFDAILNSQDVLWVGRGGVSLDAADPAGGVNSLLFQVSKGFDIGEATSAHDANSSRARGDAEFISFLLDAGRVQPLPGSFELALSGRAQVAGRKLLASEECGYGGAGIGRAFDNFEMSGDHCLMGSAELRLQPNTLVGALVGAPYGFYDVGQVWTHGASLPGELDHDSASSVGGGVRLALGEALSAYVEYAQPINHEVALEGNDDGRVFFGLTARR